MRVLFVDDNAMNRLVVKNMLSAAEVEMVEAEDAQSGLALIESAHFDLVLMDFRMPGMDGLTAIREIRARADDKARLPVIMLSADNGLDLRARAIAAGASELLSNPVQMQPLFDAIAEVLTRVDNGVAALVD